MTEFYIEKKAWNKVISYAQAAWDEHQAEIGGMMVVLKDEDGDWEVKDPKILKQKITASNTHLNKEELAKYYTKAAKKYSDYEFRFCWWHSHHTMGAFWSGTDTNTIDEFNEGDFSFALVVNLKEEYKFRVSVWQPIECHEDVDLTILGEGKKVNQSIINEVNALCEKESYGRVHTDNTMQRLPNYNNNNSLQQPNLFDKRSNTYDTEYVLILSFVEKLNNKLVAGAIDYKEYSDKIDHMNNELQAGDSDYKVRLIVQGDQEQVLYLNASDFIDSAEDDDVDSWNASFGIGRTV